MWEFPPTSCHDASRRLCFEIAKSEVGTLAGQRKRQEKWCDQSMIIGWPFRTGCLAKARGKSQEHLLTVPANETCAKRRVLRLSLGIASASVK